MVAGRMDLQHQPRLSALATFFIILSTSGFE